VAPLRIVLIIIRLKEFALTSWDLTLTLSYVLHKQTIFDGNRKKISKLFNSWLYMQLSCVWLCQENWEGGALVDIIEDDY